MIVDAGRSRFPSLRVRLLVPLIGTSLVTAILVALFSAALGNWWGRAAAEEQFKRIEKTLEEANFPLTAPVLELLADLTQSELIALDSKGEIINATLDDVDTVLLQKVWRKASSGLQDQPTL